jgi:hypothetical protein
MPEGTMRRIGGFKGPITELRLSPHHRWLVVCSNDGSSTKDGDRYASLWDLSRENPSRVPARLGTTTTARMAFTSDEQAIIVVNEDSLVIHPLGADNATKGSVRIGPLPDMARLAPTQGPFTGITPGFALARPDVFPKLNTSENRRWIILDQPDHTWWKMRGRNVLIVPSRLEDLLTKAGEALPIDNPGLGSAEAYTTRP